ILDCATAEFPLDTERVRDAAVQCIVAFAEIIGVAYQRMAVKCGSPLPAPLQTGAGIAPAGHIRGIGQERRKPAAKPPAACPDAIVQMVLSVVNTPTEDIATVATVRDLGVEVIKPRLHVGLSANTVGNAPQTPVTAAPLVIHGGLVFQLVVKRSAQASSVGSQYRHVLADGCFHKHIRTEEP